MKAIVRQTRRRQDMKYPFYAIAISVLLAGCVTTPPPRNLRDIIQKAENGDVKAQAEIGYSYQYGDGISRDAKEALKWNLKAANQGNAMAQHNVAVMYDEGTDIPQNKTEAVKWYQKAADQGHPRAQLNLGVMYWKGDGVTKDIKRGWTLLNQARVASQSKQENWAARRAMDAIKKEIHSGLGPFDYPEWDIVQKTIRKQDVKSSNRTGTPAGSTSG
jgi:TPR repeat protein